MPSLADKGYPLSRALGLVLFGYLAWLGGSAGIPYTRLTIAIVFVLRDAVREIWWRLMDAVDPSLVGKLEAAAKDVDGIQSIDTMRVRWIGHTLHAEANVEVDGSLSTRDSHAIAEEVRHAMLHAAPGRPLVIRPLGSAAPVR